MNALIDRPRYMDQLMRHKDVDLIKIITGIRRCGKSSLLDLFHDRLLSMGVSKNRIIHMNLESLSYADLTNHLAFYRHVSDQITEKGRYYLLFDEVQAVDGWERAVESFRIDHDVDIYLTGSNAYLLSSELSTLLSGRCVQIKMMPLSFQEFLRFHEFAPETSLEEKFALYMRFGGMPILKEYGFDQTACNQALEGIFSTIALKDIMQRNSIGDASLITKLARFLCSNLGSITSPNNVANVLLNEGALEAEVKKAKVAPKTIEKYLNAFCDAFVFYQASRYDIKGKQHLKTLAKYYVADLGFRNMLFGARDADRGHLLENAVYLELVRRGYRVFIGKVRETEIDFVAEKPENKLYVQVTESMNVPEVRACELGPFEQVDDHYEKIVLSLDRDFVDSYNGVRSLNVIDWLLEE